MQAIGKNFSPPQAVTLRHAAPAARSPEPATTTPVASTADTAARKVPPGLQRVAARLENLGVEGRSPGQNNALTQITRNLQRYVDVQAMATPTVPPAPTAPEVPTAPEAGSEPAPVDTTPTLPQDDAGPAVLPEDVEPAAAAA